MIFRNWGKENSPWKLQSCEPAFSIKIFYLQENFTQVTEDTEVADRMEVVTATVIMDIAGASMVVAGDTTVEIAIREVDMGVMAETITVVAATVAVMVVADMVVEGMGTEAGYQKS